MPAPTASLTPLQRRILELLADLEPPLALLAEKLCALLGRAKPRDLDDVGRLLDELREDLAVGQRFSSYRPASAARAFVPGHGRILAIVPASASCATSVSWAACARSQ